MKTLSLTIVVICGCLLNSERNLAGNVPLEYFLPYIKGFAIVDGPNSGAKQPDTVYLKDLKSGISGVSCSSISPWISARAWQGNRRISFQDNTAADPGIETPKKLRLRNEALY
jgi:hypothetical protein